MKWLTFFVLGAFAGILIGLAVYWMLDLIPGQPFARRPGPDEPLYP